MHLARANLLDTLVENSVRYSYTDSWAIRFHKRHNIVSRVETTNMREIPADFEVKKEKYIKIAADLIYQYQVPPELVINGDETTVQLVSRANRTRNSRGAKRSDCSGWLRTRPKLRRQYSLPKVAVRYHFK